MANESDILQEIPIEDLPKLSNLYKKHVSYAPHAYSTLNTAIKWIKARPDRKYFTFFAPDGDWSDGTFIALMQWSCYDLFVFTLDKDCTRLYKALKETNRINWKNHVMFYALHKDHRETVLKVLDELSVPIIYDTKTHYWMLPSEEAAKITFECPDGYYLETLQPKHASIINDLWPHRYEGSVEYVSTFIEMNGGHGIFTNSDDRLVCWILKCQMGTLALLQTVDDFKRKGLAKVITKSLSKEIGLEGHCPIGTVLFNNVASQNMFKALGFEILDWNSFLGVGKDVEKHST